TGFRTAHLGIESVFRRDPVDGRLHLAGVGRVAAPCRWIVVAMDLTNLAGLLVLHHAGALDEVPPAQPDLTAGRQPEELLWRIFAEIILFNVEHARELHVPRPGAGIFGIVHRL